MRYRNLRNTLTVSLWQESHSAKEYSGRIKDAVNETFAPKFFGVMYQAKATLDHEGLDDGIICHIVPWYY